MQVHFFCVQMQCTCNALAEFCMCKKYAMQNFADANKTAMQCIINKIKVNKIK